MHLGYHVYVLATQSPDVEATRPLLYGTVFVLLALTFALNLVAIAIRTRTPPQGRRRTLSMTSSPAPAVRDATSKMETAGLEIRYGAKAAVKDVQPARSPSAR